MFYLFLVFRVSNHRSAFQSLFWLSKLPSSHAATKYFRSGIIYVQNWRVCELLKCILAMQKQLTASNKKSDGPQVNIWNTWKRLKYLNINDSFYLKDLEISKYKRESKARMSIKYCCLIFVNCGLFSFLNIKKVKI